MTGSASACPSRSTRRAGTPGRLERSRPLRNVRAADEHTLAPEQPNPELLLEPLPLGPRPHGEPNEPLVVMTMPKHPGPPRGLPRSRSSGLEQRAHRRRAARSAYAADRPQIPPPTTATSTRATVTRALYGSALRPDELVHDRRRCRGGTRRCGARLHWTSTRSQAGRTCRMKMPPDVLGEIGEEVARILVRQRPLTWTRFVPRHPSEWISAAEEAAREARARLTVATAQARCGGGASARAMLRESRQAPRAPVGGDGCRKPLLAFISNVRIRGRESPRWRPPHSAMMPGYWASQAIRR